MANTEVTILINPIAKVTRIVNPEARVVTTTGSFESQLLVDRKRLIDIEGQIAGLERVHERIAFEISELKAISEKLAKAAGYKGPEDPMDAGADEDAKNTDSD